MNPGDTFLLPDQISSHLNVVLAVLDDGSVITAHLTTLTNRSDKTCIIRAGEHSFVKHDTVIRYDQVQHCENGMQLDAFKRIVEQGRKFEAFSAELLARVLQGALDSPQTKQKIKDLLRPA